jgi:hypothetical protein
MPISDGKVYVVEDVSDWFEEFKRHEPTLENDGDIVDLVVKGGFTTGEVAKMAISGRAAEAVPDSILDSDKLLLYAGGRAHVAHKIAKCKRAVIMPSGREYEAREFIGTPGRVSEEDGEIEPPERQRTVAFDTEAGMELAISHLFNFVTGNIFERFVQIAAAGGDVEDIAGRLKDEIDDMVRRIVEPQS